MKILKRLILSFIILFLCSTTSFAEVDFSEQISDEEGSLFEKIIAETIGGVAQTIFNLVTQEDSTIGFKNYDDLIFNNGISYDDLSPFTTELWTKTIDFYYVLSVIAGVIILIAIFILVYKIIFSAINPLMRNEAKDNLLRLVLGGIMISLTPIFIRFLLYLNNSFVYIISKLSSNGSIDSSIGEDMLTSISTGNAITTALVISMFIYLFFKINFKFMIRQFTIIIFTIFSPIAISLWIINKNVTALMIWTGQIIMNIFMQSIYCFLFSVYVIFLPSSEGWLVSLIWAMMILPLAEALQNCLQDLTSRIAGVDNEQNANYGIGMGAAMGYTVGAIKEQFKGTKNNSNISMQGNNSSESKGTFSGIINTAKGFINPQNKTNTNEASNITSNSNQQDKPNEPNKISKGAFIAKAAEIGYKGTKSYLGVGAKMAEGNWNTKNDKNTTTKANKKYDKDSIIKNSQYDILDGDEDDEIF